MIDVNLPKHASDEDDSQEHEEQDTIEYRIREATQLLTYLWDNYIELNNSTHVFLLGTNTGHGAIVNFLKANEERAEEKLTTAISFVEDVPLQSCKSVTNDALAPWYYAHSLVFVAPEHNWWSSGVKPRKRFGRLTQTASDSISAMLIEQRNNITTHMLRESAGWQAQAAAADVMDVSDAESPTSPKQQLPPVGNFALSPRPKSSAGIASPRGRQSRTPQSGSPSKAPPPSSFGPPPR